MDKKAVSAIIFALLLTSTLTRSFNIHSTKAESGTARIDNLIITNSDLEVAATGLAQWKNSCGIPSNVLNVTWIYSHYPGVDEPEKIRNCIKDFHSNFLTKYVTIFGDDDIVPIRYAYVPYGGEDLVATDLYYADLNRTWDDNQDGLYADLRNDIIDGIPDVCVGRIPVSLTDVAQGVVTKIIEYQQQFDVSADWTNRVVLAAGWFDGGCAEWAVPNCGNVSKILVGKNAVRLYESAGNLTNSNVDYEMGRGCSFLNFAGHSEAPGILGYPKEYPWLLYKDFWLGPQWLGWNEVLGWTNGRKLPVVVSSACSSAKISVQECIGEYFVTNQNGGAIAYFGPTGISPYNPDRLTGELMLRIYQAFTEGHTRLGDMWSVAISNYIQNYSWSPIEDERTMIEFILLGDPTLRIYDGPETIEVPNECVTIQGAINSAYSGDTIKVASGNYYENVVVNKKVSLVGESPTNTTIYGNGNNPAVEVSANGSVIDGFTVKDGYFGIFVHSCNNVTIQNNLIIGNEIGIDLAYGSSNNTVAGNSLNSNDDGIKLDSSTRNTIIQNNLTTNNLRGILLEYSEGNNLVENYVASNIGWGIHLNHSSYNTLARNNATSNYDGINLRYVSNYNNITGNIIRTNYRDGIELDYSASYNSITGNQIEENARNGIELWDSSNNNRISGNRIAGNYYGVWLGLSADNSVFHNNFLDNTKQILPTDSFENSWDNNYPSGGNYWSDHTGIDLYRGVHQNETGSDGIEDAPYIIDSNNQDNYPLINPWNPPEITVTYVSSFFKIGNVVILRSVFPTPPPSFNIFVNVTIQNQGNKLEVFNMTAYCNSTIIGTQQSIFLDNGSSITINFALNTTTLAKGNYTIWACVTPVEGETDTADNTWTDGIITIVIGGDVNADGKVDVKDVYKVALAYGTSLEGPNPPGRTYEPNCDINGDDKVDVKDYYTVCKHYGEVSP